MSSKTISLESSAYNLLLRAKREGESFSMVVQRVMQPSRDPMRQLVGLLPAAKGKRMRELLDKQRELERASMDDRYRRLGLL